MNTTEPEPTPGHPRRTADTAGGTVSTGIPNPIRRLLVLVLCLGVLTVPAPSAYGATATVTYPASAATMANPERGLYRHQGNCDRDDFKLATLQQYRTTDKATLVMCLFYLKEFVDADISAAQLARLETQAQTVRSAGLKMIVRFAYTEDPVKPVDANLARIQRHLDQLAGFFIRNNDIIDVVQSGFIGAWGEGAYSQSFGTAPNISGDQWLARRAVVDKLLSVVPSSRMVQLRTPTMKQTMFGTAPVSAGQAYSTLPAARVGHHNDCFLASTRDSGTYQDPAVEYPYLAADTTYVAMGGETCRVNTPRSDCATAQQELGLFHYSYLNKDWKPEVLQRWADEGCLTAITQRLGYRFSLVSATMSTTAVRGGSLGVQFKMKNSGYSAPHNARPVYLVLRHGNGQVVRLRLSTDPRRWAAGATTTVTQSVQLPTKMSVGTYSAFLQLPDPVTALASRPEYSIQLANTMGRLPLWESATGYNPLLMQVNVS